MINLHTRFEVAMKMWKAT